MMEPNNNFTFLIKQYEKLKDEQHKRIEFHDLMIYLTLAAIGTVFSFALEKPDFNIALLVLPFLCIVLGWTYLSNDEKISAIGNYFRTCLAVIIWNMVVKSVPHENPEGYLFLDQKRKLGMVTRIRKQIDKFGLTNEELGIVTH